MFLEVAPLAPRCAATRPQADRDLKAHNKQHPRSGDPDALFWPGRSPRSHREDYRRVWDPASFRRNYFKPALTRAELAAIRVHDLRHLQPACGSPQGSLPYQVSRWLGHASVVTTDRIYWHLYPTDYAQHIAWFERFATG